MPSGYAGSYAAGSECPVPRQSDKRSTANFGRKVRLPRLESLRSSSRNEKERWKGRVSLPFASCLGELGDDELHVGPVVGEQRGVAAGVVVIEDDQDDPHDLRHTAGIIAVVVIVLVVSRVVPVLPVATIAVVRMVPVTVVFPVVFDPPIVAAIPAAVLLLFAIRAAVAVAVHSHNVSRRVTHGEVHRARGAPAGVRCAIEEHFPEPEVLWVGEHSLRDRAIQVL